MVKTAVITGANRGIGLATTNKFLNEGWQVIGTSRSGKIGIESENLKVVKLELKSPGSINSAAKEISGMAEGIDALVNNAGIAVDFSNSNVHIEKLRETLEVNLIGLIVFAEQLIPKMNSGGHIVNISSQAGSITKHMGNYAPAYKISKVSLNMYTRTLADRLKTKGIAVSSLDPGWVATDMGGSSAPRKPEEAAEDIYNLATKDGVQTGQFWLQGKKREW